MPDWYNPQYLNRYSYVLNNPVKYTDPTGHGAPEDLWAWIQQILRAVVKLPQQAAFNACAQTLDVSCGRTTSIPSISDLARGGVKAYSSEPRFGPSVPPEFLKAMNLTAQATETILKYGIKPYGEISSDEKNGKPAHHLVEKRFWRQLGFKDKEQAQGEILAVVIGPDVHGPEGKGEPTLTDMLRDSIGHQLSNDAEPQDIWNAHRDAYRKAGHDDWAELIWEVYFKDMGIEKEE